MYIGDFLKKVFKKGNTTILIYFFINMLLVVGIIALCFAEVNIFLGIGVGVGLYAVSVIISLSSFGEWMRRRQLHCIPMSKNPGLEAAVMPLIDEVYSRAKEETPELAGDIKFYYLEDDSVNAFAAGRKTICIHTGTLQRHDDETIKAVLAHEFGHIAHHDTDLGLFVNVGNLIINVFFILCSIGVGMMHLIGSIFAIFTSDDDGGLAYFFVQLSSWLSQVALSVAQLVWVRFGQIMLAKASRNQEFEADIFAAKLGYGVPLCELFDTWGNDTPKDLFEGMFRDHPSSPERIENLQKFGVPFTGLSPERRQVLLEEYKRSKKKQKRGCMVGCGIVVILAFAAIIAGAIGGVLKSRENRKHRVPETVQTVSEQSENVETEEILPETVQNEIGAETEKVPESVDLASVQAVVRESSNVDLSAAVPMAFADAYASSVVAQEGYDNSSLVAIDGLLETSWQEGVDGNGEGEYLELYLNGEQPVKYLVLNLGNWRSNDWFYDNNRPRSLTIQVGDYITTQEFPDGQIEQCVEFSQPVPASTVRLTINSVYEGRDWQDTCIAEVRAYGE